MSLERTAICPVSRLTREVKDNWQTWARFGRGIQFDLGDLHIA